VKTNEFWLVYDGMLPIQERDTNNNVFVTYTRGLDFSASIEGAGGIGGVLARTDASGSGFFHCDGKGRRTPRDGRRRRNRCSLLVQSIRKGNRAMGIIG